MKIPVVSPEINLCIAVPAVCVQMLPSKSLKWVNSESVHIWTKLTIFLGCHFVLSVNNLTFGIFYMIFGHSLSWSWPYVTKYSILRARARNHLHIIDLVSLLFIYFWSFKITFAEPFSAGNLMNSCCAIFHTVPSSLCYIWSYMHAMVFLNVVKPNISDTLSFLFVLHYDSLAISIVRDDCWL